MCLLHLYQTGVYGGYIGIILMTCIALTLNNKEAGDKGNSGFKVWHRYNSFRVYAYVRYIALLHHWFYFIHSERMVGKSTSVGLNSPLRIARNNA